MNYEWDQAKADLNLRQHGVDFPRAVDALEDPFKIEELDLRESYGEERVQTIGWARGGILFVVTTLRSHDICRIILARKATRHERQRYEDR
ncbi:MAG: BrnT family toxin [Alphaproteobacteria bacterium]|nr:BrnT family toxin [Alphaproteobacteria bacterium]